MSDFENDNDAGSEGAVAGSESNVDGALASSLELPCAKCSGCGACIVHRPQSCVCAGGPR